METSVILAIIGVATTMVATISAGYGLVYRGQLKAQERALKAEQDARATERVAKERAEMLADRSAAELHESNLTIAAQTAAIQGFKEIAVMMVTQGTENAKFLAEIATRLDAMDRRWGGTNARQRKPPV